jgi:hypothetical protein
VFVPLLEASRISLRSVVAIHSANAATVWFAVSAGPACVYVLTAAAGDTMDRYPAALSATVGTPAVASVHPAASGSQCGVHVRRDPSSLSEAASVAGYQGMHAVAYPANVVIPI